MSAADQTIFPGPGDIRRVLPDDASYLKAYLKSRPLRKLDDTDIDRVVDAACAIMGALGIPFRMGTGMMCLETNDFQYTGQVGVTQKNIGGIGATNDGAAGISNPSWGVAVAIYVAHLCAWCNLDGLGLTGVESPRLAAVRATAKIKGYCRTFRDLGGRWAVADGVPWQRQATMPGNYGEKIENRARVIYGTPDEVGGGKRMRVEVTAGHHNTSGGNGEEAITTGIMTPLVIEELRARGIDTDTVTPDGGRGMYPGSLTAVANEVVRRSRDGMFQIFVELHTEGVGNPGVNGIFSIYPDDPTGQTGDLDADVRDTLGPMIAQRVAQRTGMGIRGNGVMSERNTAVGLDGDRLGIFKATEAIRDECTRLIIEMGAHSNAADFKRHRDPQWQRQTAVAIAECFLSFLTGEPLPGLDAPLPKLGGQEPKGGGPSDNPQFFPTPGTDGFYVIGPFFDFYHAEPQAMRYWGWPRTGMFVDDEPLSPYFGQLVQYFDRAVFHAPDGETDPGRVQLGLLGYNEALGRGLIKP